MPPVLPSNVRRPARARGAVLVPIALLGAAAVGIGGFSRLDTARAESTPADGLGTIATALNTLFPAAPDVTKILGPDTCADCHAAAQEAWTKSTHYATFHELHRKKRAKEIAKAMGYRGIKSNDRCIQCHYTPQMKGEKVKPVSGISCESCHGPGADWCDTAGLHHENASKAATPDERARILARCEEAGMLRPANVYRVAKNCYSCHTVPDEKLVNVGGHTAGSRFELVSWSQGEVRHNYQNEDQKNLEATPRRKRILFMTGLMTDFEYSLRGLAVATEPQAAYAAAMKKRVSTALRRLEKVLERVELPALRAALPASGAATIDALASDTQMALATADTVSAATEKFAGSNDGTALAALDKLIPKKYKGKPH